MRAFPAAAVLAGLFLAGPCAAKGPPLAATHFCPGPQSFAFVHVVAYSAPSAAYRQRVPPSPSRVPMHAIAPPQSARDAHS